MSSIFDDFVHADRVSNIGLLTSMGFLDGYSSIQKFGENLDLDGDPEDIWEVGGLYNYDADGTAPIVSLISSSASDTEPIVVIGLDINGNEVTQELTLTGTTRVALTTPLWRVYRMYNNGTADLVGTVYCYIGTGGVPVAGDTRAIISPGNGQTLMTLYTIPAGKVGFVIRGEIGFARGVASGSIDGAFFARPFGKVFRIVKRVDINVAGISIYKDKRSFPDAFPAKTDVTIRCLDTSTVNLSAFATFDILIVDEEKFPADYLASIGQPGYA